MIISIMGDVVPTIENAHLFASGDTEALFNDIPNVLKNSNRVIVNLECALTNEDTPIKKIGPVLSAPVECINGYKALGVTDILLANNHSADAGVEGLYSTINTIKQNGMNYTGAGANIAEARKPHYIKKGNQTVAIVNTCEHEYGYAKENRAGANAYDPFDIMFDIIEAKSNSDFVIVVFHGGKEHCAYPSPRLRKLCQAFILHGAGLVLCQHSHCIGTQETFHGGQIIYGQGNFNFIYNTPAGKSPEWNKGLIVQAEITGTLCKTNLIPVVRKEAGMRLADECEKAEILSALNHRSEKLHNGEWLKEWREFCLSVGDKYQKAIREAHTPESSERQNEVFAHYLDCEAHTDVWRELNQTWTNTDY